MFTIDSSRPVLLVDFSYFICYRYYALMAWYKLSETPLETTDMLKRFVRLSESHLKKWCKKHVTDADTQILLIRDCPRNQVWRRNLDSSYKGNRDERDDHIPTEIFQSVENILLPLLRSKHNYQDVQIEQTEADDIIAWIHRHMNPTTPITVMTNDTDFLQLADDRTQLINMKAECLLRRSLGFGSTTDLLYKILIGDPSDNISRILSNKEANQLALEGADLPRTQFIEILKDKGIHDRFVSNEQLIDMRLIPPYVQDAITRTIRIKSENTD
jgi:5'-3' exonuclease